MRQKRQLTINCVRCSSLAGSDVPSAALQKVRFPFIRQLYVKNVFQAANQLRIFDREEDFDPMTQIASHEIRAAQINLLGSSFRK